MEFLSCQYNKASKILSIYRNVVETKIDGCILSFVKTVVGNYSVSFIDFLIAIITKKL